MTNFKYLQKLFFLLVMGFSLSFICACGDDEEDEPVQNPNEEITNPTDSIPSEDEPTVPNDSIADDNINPMDSIPSIDEPIVPNDSVSDGGIVVVNGHEAVDLGLSVKWATCNVGASSPEEYGGYYSWGETEEKSNYNWDTYKWCNGTMYSLNKYCMDSEFGIIDDKTVLDPADDVATVKWGKKWRMPTKEEIKELINECNLERVYDYNGVDGNLVTGPNGNSIFLPFAGIRCNDGTNTFNGKGVECKFWSTTSGGLSSYRAYAFSVGNYGDFDLYTRYYGFTVRPVTE